MALEARAKLQDVEEGQKGQKPPENTAETTTCQKPAQVAGVLTCENIEGYDLAPEER